MKKSIKSNTYVLINATLLSAAAQAQTASTGSGQAYPQRPIRLVVAVVAGGSTDVMARLVGAKLGERLGQQVVIDNRPGGSSIIGADIVAKRPRTVEQGPRLRGCDPVAGCTRRW